IEQLQFDADDDYVNATLDTSGLSLGLGEGDDTATGGSGADTNRGDGGNDSLTGGGGDDVIRGGAGADTIDGGTGNDVAEFSGAWSDYAISESGGTYTVTDLRPGSPDGTDTITNVETFRFANGDRNAADTLDPSMVFTFDGGNQGWRVYDDVGDAITGNALHNSHYGGAQIADNETGTSPWFATPLNFGGDRSDLIGGSVSFDFRNADAEPWVDDDAATIEVMLVGNDGTEIRAVINIPATTGMVNQNASFDLDAATFGVSDAAFDAVMGDLAFFGISSDIRTTMENSIIDNVTFERGPDGVVDGEETGENMVVGYDDAGGASDGHGDVITGGDDVIHGNGGNDTINSGSGDDVVHGGSGDDVIYFSQGADTVYGGDGNDVIDELAGISNFDFDNLLDGGAGNDSIWADAGDDTLIGGDGADSLRGETGHDSLDGGAGNDSLFGGDTVTTGNLITNGDFSSGASGWTVNNPTGGGAPSLTSGYARFNSGNGAVYGDSIQQDFTSHVGSTHTVTFNLRENAGGVGDHTFRIDILDDQGNVVASEFHTVHNADNDTVTFDFATTSATSTIVFTNTNATNSNGSDPLLDNISVVAHVDGDDTMDGGLGDDSIHGGTGDDVAIYDGDLGDYGIAYSGGTFTITDQNAADGDEGTDTVTGVETFRFNGTDYTAAQLQTEAARQSNLDPTDIAFASGGSIGESVVSGGSIDFAYDPSGATVATLSTTDSGGDTHSYSIVNDPSGHFEIVGNALRVRANQVIDYETTPSIDVTIRSTDQYGGSVDRTLTVNVTDFEDSFTGGNNDGSASGTSEEDYIDGRRGDDTLYGGDGNDTLIGANGEDVLYGGDGDDYINLKVGTGSGWETSDADEDRAYGGDGNDTIEGGFGDDEHIDGGDGIDLFTYHSTGDTSPLNISLTSGTYGLAGNDSDGTVTGIENVTGTFGNDTIVGDGNNNVLSGGFEGHGHDRIEGRAGDDTISGGRGADTLLGGDDDDYIAGGCSTDYMDGGSGNDTISFHDCFGGTEYVVLDLVGGTAELRRDDGTLVDTETAVNFENAIGGGGNDHITGTSGDNTLEGGAGNDTILGGSGDDSLVGGDGADSLVGGDGNDTINAFSGTPGWEQGGHGTGNADTIEGGAGDDLIYGGFGIGESVDGGTGTDTISFNGVGTGTPINIRLTDGTYHFGGAGGTITNVENVAGTWGSDTIIGDGNDNVLSGGGGGDDRITGGAGDDTIVGGSGNDTASYGGSSSDFDVSY
ncbi:MAG: DUF642 domain-containing protein, partial [Silicimonas sp.]|nr:DUF642 domain-containing protein [Silicimonas sp.]